MNNLSLDDLLSLVKEYNPTEVENVKKAYFYAERLHRGQKRQSGEEYIVHPLNVAYILASMHADKDTICAGLLHDTIEDTNVTKEQIAHDFNPSIALLVDGVTKISKLNFSSKEDEELANTRKIITGITDDVRIIIIKLADRLHNMRTLQFKSEFKQKENALETIDIFVPLAYYIGAYRIKSELEDLSLRYLKPDVYRKIKYQKDQIEYDNRIILNSMSEKVGESLTKNNIENEIKIRTKNIYGIYKKLKEGENFSNIHDLLALKIMVNNIEQCYRSLGIVHSLYYPVNEKFKDYICNPKTNMYSSLHTTVFVPNNRLVQTQIRTFDMDKIASFGLTAYWDINKGKARDVMQNELKEKFQFFKSLVQIDKMFSDNKEFVNQVKKELFGNKIYVYSSNGKIIELPENSTIVDFAYTFDSDKANSMIGAYVNDVFALPNYVLKNKDRVNIITNDYYYGPKNDWENVAQKSYVRKMIRDNKSELSN